MPVDLQALPDRFLLVVVSLDQRLAGEVILAGHLGRIELDMVDAPRARMHPAPAHALDDLVLVHVDLENEVQLDARTAHRLRLRDGAGKTVEQVPVPAIDMLQSLLDQTDDDVIRDELTRVHDFLRRDTQWGDRKSTRLNSSH